MASRADGAVAPMSVEPCATRAPQASGGDAALGLLEDRAASEAGAAGRGVVAYAASLLLAGVVLHPTLKLFYSAGPHNGQAKNTLSVVDAAAAAAAVLCLRTARNCGRRLRGLEVPRLSRRVIQYTFAPGLGVFGSISLATLANYESLWAFLMLAPLEIVFVSLLSRACQRARPTPGQTLAALLVFVGSAVLTVETLRRRSWRSSTTAPADGWAFALATSAAFRLNQALTTIFIRGACVALRRRGQEDVLDIALCKLLWVCLLCVPYALLSEGADAWRTLASARGEALFYLVLSAAVTVVFQVSNVGLNSRLKSVAATIVMQLQPVIQVCLAVLLTSTVLAEKLRLEWDPSWGNLAGSSLLLCGALCYLVATQLEARRKRALAAAAACGLHGDEPGRGRTGAPAHLGTDD